ncbi:hypothetical protein BKA59DRAFT_153883 [Fusarium tricinctum]|uniref:Uncharacterized protein n=1 Tax=Fusarium tricinctum TaxID=61284 RepID=A0A8K0WEI3_9HYPO|nr:hypothetical protein BKA59DRAFT_153883 [Fusarium tricinctum]
MHRLVTFERFPLRLCPRWDLLGGFGLWALGLTHHRIIKSLEPSSLVTLIHGYKSKTARVLGITTFTFRRRQCGYTYTYAYAYRCTRSRKCKCRHRRRRTYKKRDHRQATEAGAGAAASACNLVSFHFHPHFHLFGQQRSIYELLCLPTCLLP